ncbi:MAG: glycosyltransferase family 2 protein [bacterium]|nr:glycosyltransferase family 2 protein [bacterium]
MESPTLSLMVPLHNERANLPELLRQCVAALEATGERWELILVDDGSDDGSWQALQAAAQADPRLKVLRHDTRLGKTAAYRTGFAAAQGAYLFTLDADLQEPPEAIGAMLEMLQSGAADMVVGWRRRRRDAPHKVWASRVFNAVLRRCFGLPLHDANCGFKGMRRAVADALLPWLERDFHRYLPLIAQRLDYRVAEVEVVHCPRAHGRSRYGLERYGRAIADLWVLYRKLPKVRNAT